ncbi:MAG: hypothetical protein JO236_15505 [Mycobacterium sp.]|uniref:hypothetical protein n=1 Tax=Mycobacterium sp. TaxID=1785 RepID=UPI001EC6D2AB|nr:hypothetical protein [Mycobacterium sp.]MBW0018933.1 hypothetical protein [Mycobacterium sp.]
MTTGHSGTESSTFATTVAGPYQSLFSNTGTNLQVLGGALSANPGPFFRQVVANQIGYPQLLGTSLQNALINLPATVANLPSEVQAGLQALTGYDPVAAAQQISTNQTTYFQTISTSLNAAYHDFNTGLQALPASFQQASQALAAGDFTDAVSDLQLSFKNLFITDFDVTSSPTGVLSITPTGALGDLLPVFAIPGQMAQNFTNLLPAGSVPALASQSFTNLVDALTNTATTSTLTAFLDPNAPLGLGVAIDAQMGLPLALAIDAAGSPVTTFNALNSSALAFANAVHTGDWVDAAVAVLDAPAVVANGFVNGQTTLPLTIDALGIPTTLNIPLSGILVPPGPYTATIPLLETNATVTGTPLGGIVPGLLNFLPEHLAEAIGGPVVDS